MLISVIVPCFNEEAVIVETYRQLTDVMKKLPHNYELLFVNDGSADNTLHILTDLSKTDKMVKILSFSRNFGHQCALTAGLNNCSGDVAVTIDGDLQDPPKVIPDMLALMQAEHANVVYAVRKKRDGEPAWRLFAIKAFYRLLNKLSDTNIPVDTGDFRIVDRKVIDRFNSLNEKNKYIRGLIYWMGFKQLPFYYDREGRFAGETKYPFAKLLHLASTGIVGFSKKPLTMATTLGCFSVLLGLLYLLLILIARVFLEGFVITGFASTAALIIFFGGVQLLTIGVLGTYIGSLFDEVKGRPEYIISEKINLK